MRRLLLPALALVACALPAPLRAQAPIQVALFPPVQFVPENEGVEGLRLSIYGRNASMTGLDFGVVTHTTGTATALQIAVVNLVEGDFTGVQVGWGFGAGVANVVEGRMKGLQAAVLNTAGSGEGLQLGIVNHTSGRMEGLQVSFVNIADDMNGLQVGFINVIRSKERFSVLPLVNWKFE